MTIRADTNPRFFLRFALIAVVCIGFAFWSLYDGYIAYPNQRIRALRYLELEEADQLDQWETIAKENGWPLENPGEPKEDYHIGSQYFMAGVCGPVGLFFLYLYLRSRGRWIEANEAGLRSSWGQELEFDQILTLNKKQWKNKGIAKIAFQAGRRKKRLILDDCKYNRELIETILRLVESKIESDQIINGTPEPPFVEQEESVTSTES